MERHMATPHISRECVGPRLRLPYQHIWWARPGQYGPVLRRQDNSCNWIGKAAGRVTRELTPRIEHHHKSGGTMDDDTDIFDIDPREVWLEKDAIAGFRVWHIIAAVIGILMLISG